MVQHFVDLSVGQRTKPPLSFPVETASLKLSLKVGNSPMPSGIHQLRQISAVLTVHKIPEFIK